MANGIVDLFLHAGLIEQDQRAWCRYMAERQTMNVLSLALLLLVGLLLAPWAAAVCFVLAFRFLRERTGGYHAKTVGGCLAASLFTQQTALGLALRLPTWQWLGLALAAVVILLLAPGNNAAIHLTQEELEAARPRVALRLGCVMVASALASWAGQGEATAGLAAAIVADGGLLLASRMGMGVQ